MTIKKAIFPLGLLASVTAAQAATMIDTVGDVAVGVFPHLDISSVEVSNTATILSFKINLDGDPVTTDWGKYLVGISTVVGGDTASNGWNRPISMSDGMEHWIGSWVDGGNGAELYDYTGAWVLNSATYAANPANIAISKDAGSVSLSLDLAALGLSVNDTILFDVYTTGGGGSDGAVDSLAAAGASIANWGDSFNTDPNSGGTNPALSYTVIPETSAALLGTIGLFGLLRRRR